jgi:DNA-binding PadR family transcriptional regulator
MAGLTPVEVVTLAGLSEGPLHGYGLVVRIEELTGGRMRVRPGNLYRVLSRLEAASLVEETEVASEDVVEERRRNFRLTKEGRRVVSEELRMYATILSGSPALRRAGGDG